MLAPAETPDKIIITLPEDDARWLVKRVLGGRLAVKLIVLPKVTDSAILQDTVDDASLILPLTGSEQAIVRNRESGGEAISAVEIDPSTGARSFAWDVSTIRSVSALLTYAEVDDACRTGRLLSQSRPEPVSDRVFDVLRAAELTLRRTYEESQGHPYPLPPITNIVGPPYSYE